MHQRKAAVRRRACALHTLNDRPDLYPDDPGADDVWRTRIAQYLRAVLAMFPTHDPGRSGPYGEAVAAVTAACADLDGGDLLGAYLALRAASTALQQSAYHRTATDRPPTT